MMCFDVFEDDCNKLTINLDPKEVVKASKFISIIKRINKRNPLVFIPDLLEDITQKKSTSEIIEKYHIWNYSSFQTLIDSNLKLKGFRIKFSKNKAENNDFENSDLQKQYNLLHEQANLFHIPLLKMLNCNILKTIIAYTILKTEYIPRGDIENTILKTYAEIKQKINIFSNAQIQHSFDDYFNNDLTNKINSTLSTLVKELHITNIDGNISISNKYLDLDKNIHEIISNEKQGITYNSIMAKILNKFILLKLVPRFDIFDEILNKLEQDKKIIRKRTYLKLDQHNDQFFIPDNYDIIVKKMKANVISMGKIKFFGRHITPDAFIAELKNLDVGDIEDHDDQVTRIAGLVLSDAVLLQSPRETMQEFDFIIDLTNYNFRPEQKKIMKKMDLQITANIIHCKVMINSIVTMNTLSELRGAIPNGEQAVIFTCKEIAQNILEYIKNDHTVQIINEYGIHSWCSITPTIPCRLHSIAQVMFGEGRGVVGLVKSLNYESGLAIVENIDHTESSFQIGCLKEIDLQISSYIDYKVATEIYFDFLRILESLAPNSFKDGMNLKIKNVHLTYENLMKSTNPELFGGSHPEMSYDSTSNAHIRYVEFYDKLYTKININPNLFENSFECTCGHKLNEEHYHTLCKHIVAGINHICIDKEQNWDIINENIENFEKQLDEFQNSNIKRAINTIYDILKPESQYLFKQYLKTHIDDDDI